MTFSCINSYTASPKDNIWSLVPTIVFIQNIKTDDNPTIPSENPPVSRQQSKHIPNVPGSCLESKKNLTSRVNKKGFGEELSSSGSHGNRPERRELYPDSAW